MDYYVKQHPGETYSLELCVIICAGVIRSYWFKDDSKLRAFIATRTHGSEAIR